MIDLLLERVRRSIRIRQVLADLCDFDVSNSVRSADWFRVECAEQFQVIAGDASGGAFLLGASGRLLHLTSEGQAGVVAPTLRDALAVLVALPYWRELLKFSGGGLLAEMKRAAAYLEETLLEDKPSCAHQRSIANSELSLPLLADPVATLHEAVATQGSDVRVLSLDGFALTSLFNTFTVDQYLAYKRT